MIPEKLEKIKSDTNLVLNFLEEHSSGSEIIDYNRLRYPDINLDESDILFLISTIEPMGSILSIIDSPSPELRTLSYDDSPVQAAMQKFVFVYDTALKIRQDKDTATGQTLPPTPCGYLWLKMLDFRTSILNLERFVLVSKSISYKQKGEKTYTEHDVEVKIRENEHLRCKLRQELYFRVDQGAKNLSDSLLSPKDDKVLDSAISKLLYLGGFDTEIYNPLQADLDVIALCYGEKTALLVESTTGNMSKAKIDQLLGREKQYGDLLSKQLALQSLILLAITSKERSSLDDIAKKEAMVNRVSVLTKEDLNEMIKLLIKSKLNPSIVISFIKKHIPVV